MIQVSSTLDMQKVLLKKSIILSGSSKGILISKNKGIDVNTQEDWNKLKKFL